VTYDVGKIRYISLIRLEGGESILNIPYAEYTVDPDLIAGFVTAVIIFAKTPIRTIRKAVYDIMIEVGQTVLVLLVADPVPDEAPYREKMRRILANVESEHGERLRRFEGDIRQFREFALKVIVEYPYPTPDLSLIPVRKETGGLPIPFRVGEVDSKLEKVEAFISGKRTVEEIIDLIGLDEAEVRALISILWRYKWIYFKKRLSETDVLKRVDCSKSVLERLRNQYGQPLDDIIRAFDGVKTVREVKLSLPYDQSAIWFLINKLMDVNCLEVKEAD